MTRKILTFAYLTCLRIQLTCDETVQSLTFHLSS